MEKGGSRNSHGILNAAKPKVDCHKEVLLRHPKKESERFLPHGVAPSVATRMVCSDLEWRLMGSSYGQWRRVAAEILIVS